MNRPSLPRPPVMLGLAGLLPQAACLGLVLLSGHGWAAIAIACFYAAVILSFLGGMWWMAALMAGRGDWAPYVLAVAPSLAGWAALVPWTFGWPWPGPSLIVLGVLLLASPLADVVLRRIADLPSGWLALRWVLAVGLGSLTLLVAATAPTP